MLFSKLTNVISCAEGDVSPSPRLNGLGAALARSNIKVHKEQDADEIIMMERKPESVDMRQ